MSPAAIALLLLAAPGATPSPPQAAPSEDPVELGRVKWARDHDQAFAAARASAKPVLLLFQEIPG